MMYLRDDTDNLNKPPRASSSNWDTMPATGRQTLIGLMQEDHNGRLQLIHALECPCVVAPVLEAIFNAATSQPDELGWKLVKRLIQDLQREAGYPSSEASEAKHE